MIRTINFPRVEEGHLFNLGKVDFIHYEDATYYGDKEFYMDNKVLKFTWNDKNLCIRVLYYDIEEGLKIYTSLGYVLVNNRLSPTFTKKICFSRYRSYLCYVFSPSRREESRYFSIPAEFEKSVSL